MRNYKSVRKGFWKRRYRGAVQRTKNRVLTSRKRKSYQRYKVGK